MYNIDYLQVTGIVKNTKDITKGSIYCCFVGERFDGHDYIEEAFKLGASFVIGTKDFDYQYYIKVPNINDAMAEISQKYYNYTSTKMKFIGVTGTDGKTSTTLIVNQLLNKLATSSYLGTSGLSVNGKKGVYNGMTTPFSNDLYKYINTANDKSDNFIMEVSSHALSQERIKGLNFDIVGFTNLTNDHLDFHKTIEHYFESKSKIIEYLKPSGILVANIDDVYGRKLFSNANCNKVSIGKQGQYKISDINLSISGTSFNLSFKGVTYQVESSLLAEFNVYNLVMAIAIVNQLGYNITDIISLCTDLSVEGRLELIKKTNAPTIILDFAHTADAISKIVEFINEFKGSSKVTVLTGSAGGRDKSKRLMMGKMASKYSNVLVLTEDDPRDETVASINNDLKSGIENENCQIIEIENRVKAIEYCIVNSSECDIIVLLGKSGQDLMYYKDNSVEYIEKNVVYDLIKELL